MVTDLFRFPLEFDEARWAVVTDSELRDITMCPVDTVEIQDDINCENTISFWSCASEVGVRVALTSYDLCAKS